MSNKNSLNSMGIEGNALNLSLTGSQVSNRVVPNRSARKPPTVLAKTSSARSNSNYMDPLKQKDTNSPLNSSRVPAVASGVSKSRNMPPMYQTRQKAEELKLTNESISQSNNLTPLSVRSSTDSVDFKPQLQKPAPISYDNPLDFFFGKESTPASEVDYEAQSRISHTDAIAPVTDENKQKISKLQSSCDNLRRELQRSSDQEASLKQRQQRVELTRRKLSALKIQTWY